MRKASISRQPRIHSPRTAESLENGNLRTTLARDRRTNTHAKHQRRQADDDDEDCLHPLGMRGHLIGVSDHIGLAGCREPCLAQLPMDIRDVGT